MLTVVYFLLALGLLIAVHEYGHYLMARWCGVRVLRFSVGIGPPLIRWRFRSGGTEFVIGLIPLGGFVKMLDERETAVLARERQMAFNAQPLRSRAMIVLAGPAANFLLAIFLYAIVSWSGVEHAKPLLSTPVAGSMAELAGLRSGNWVFSASTSDEVVEKVDSFDQLRWILVRSALTGVNVKLTVADQEGDQGFRIVELPLAALNVDEVDAKLYTRIGLLTPFATPVVGQVIPGGAADLAGLKEGDVVRKIDNISIVDGQQLRELIRFGVNGSGEPTPKNWLIERGHQIFTLSVSSKPEMSDGKWIGRIGAYIGGVPAMTVIQKDIFDSVLDGFDKTWDMSFLTLKMMGKMLVGDASLSNLSGPISIAEHAGKSAELGLGSYALFLAAISVSLGVLNLLPVPVLDGGHLMYYLYEVITGQEPSAVWADRFQRGGLILLMGMMTIALFNDIARFLG